MQILINKSSKSDNLGWALLNLRLRQLAWNSGWYLYTFTIFNLCLGLSLVLKGPSIGGHLYFKHFWFLVWSPELQFKISGRSDQWLLRYSTLIFWGRHHFNHFWFRIGPLRLSLKFEEDLRYSTFDILRSSSIEGHLHFKHF